MGCVLNLFASLGKKKKEWKELSICRFTTADSIPEGLFKDSLEEAETRICGLLCSFQAGYSKEGDGPRSVDLCSLGEGKASNSASALRSHI